VNEDRPGAQGEKRPPRIPRDRFPAFFGSSFRPSTSSPSSASTPGAWVPWSSGSCFRRWRRPSSRWNSGRRASGPSSRPVGRTPRRHHDAGAGGLDLGRLRGRGGLAPAGAPHHGVYGVVFLFALGYEGSFRVLLSVVAHALLVVAVGALVLVPLRILAGDANLTLSVATLLPFLGDGFLLRFAGLLDLFNLWAYVLIGVGAAVMDGRRSPAAGVAVSLGVALILSLLLAAISGMGGAGSPGA
jgi:hypothetical protein